MDYFQLYIKSTYKDQILAQQWQVREGLLCELHTWEFSEVCRLLDRWYCIQWPAGKCLTTGFGGPGRGILTCHISDFHGENIPPNGRLQEEELLRDVW